MGTSAPVASTALLAPFLLSRARQGRMAEHLDWCRSHSALHVPPTRSIPELDSQGASLVALLPSVPMGPLPASAWGQTVHTRLSMALVCVSQGTSSSKMEFPSAMRTPRQTVNPSYMTGVLVLATPLEAATPTALCFVLRGWGPCPSPAASVIVRASRMRTKSVTSNAVRSSCN